MATNLISDYSGIPDANPITVTFMGTTYKADVHLDDILEGQLTVKALMDMGSSYEPSRARRARLKQRREWAKEQGYTVSKTGRLPDSVVQAYEEYNEAV